MEEMECHTPPLLASVNENSDSKAKGVIDKACNDLINYMKPDPILNSGTVLFEFRERRDIKEEKNTSEKNRSMLRSLRARGNTGYVNLKDCLKQTGQSKLAELLECIENEEDTSDLRKNIRDEMEQADKQVDKGNKFLTEACDIHVTKTLDMYCENHDVVGCTRCMILEHRNCTDVQPVPDVSDTLFKESLVKEIHKKIIEMKMQIEEIKTSKEKSLEELKKSREESINEIKRFRRELESVLEHLEQESIREVEKGFNQLHSTLHNKIAKADEELQNMKQAALQLKKSESNIAQQFVSVKVSQKKIAKTEKVLLALRSGSNDRISFAPHSNLDTLQQLSSLGLVTHESSAAFRRKTSLYVIKTARELIVKTQDDSKTCHIFGSCLTDDCELLLADFYNKSLKRVDIMKMSVTDQCVLPCGPRSVCQTQLREVAVTLSDNSIQFISLEGQMKTTRRIELNHGCCGIAYKDDRLYITDWYISLYIYDIAGTLLQTVSLDESGKNLFKQSRHVVFSDTGNTIIVTDYSNGLIALDDHMKHSYSFSDCELSLSVAHAVCSDGRGNILVGGLLSHNVIQLGANGKKVGVVVQPLDGLSRPLSMCFERKMCTLIITQNDSNIVKFFDLK